MIFKLAFLIALVSTVKPDAKNPGTPIGKSTERVILEAPAITNIDIEKAEVTKGCTKPCSITLYLNKKGAEKFAAVTKANVGRRMAIVADGKILSAPTIMQEIHGGFFTLSLGDLDEKQALEAANNIAKRHN